MKKLNTVRMFVVGLLSKYKLQRVAVVVVIKNIVMVKRITHDAAYVDLYLLFCIRTNKVVVWYFLENELFCNSFLLINKSGQFMWDVQNT